MIAEHDEPDLHYLAVMASRLPPSERLEILAAMAELFCPHCGEDYPATGSCHCTNDE